MARTKKITVEAEVPEEATVEMTIDAEVADAYKGYTSLILGGLCIPIVGGKVNVSNETYKSLVDKGFAK